MVITPQPQARKPLTCHDVRAELTKSGYLALPIAYREKRPHIQNWQFYKYDPERPVYEVRGTPHPATGIRCANVVAFDVDCDDEETRDDVRAIIEKVCGDTLAVRYRDGSAKIAMFYRPEPFFNSAEGTRFRLSQRQKLEIYNSGGVQLLVHGEHADSTDDKPIYYRWEEDPLWDIPVGELTPVTQQQVADAVRQAVEAYPPPDGATATLSGQSEPPEQLVRNIFSSQDFHESTVALAGHLAGMAWPPDLIATYLDWVFNAVAPEFRDKRYWERRADVDRCVRDIYNAELKRSDCAYADLIKNGLMTGQQMARPRRGKR